MVPAGTATFGALVRSNSVRQGPSRRWPDRGTGQLGKCFHINHENLENLLLSGEDGQAALREIHAPCDAVEHCLNNSGRPLPATTLLSPSTHSRPSWRSSRGRPPRAHEQHARRQVPTGLSHPSQ